MALSCQCNDFDGDGWWFSPPTDETILKTKRSRRCCSCNDLVKPGDVVVPFLRFRLPNHYIEGRIYGDDVPLSTWFMCEKCGDLYWALDELGFCIMLGDEMRELTREYAEVYGPQNKARTNA